MNANATIIAMRRQLLLRAGSAVEPVTVGGGGVATLAAVALA